MIHRLIQPTTVHIFRSTEHLCVGLCASVCVCGNSMRENETDIERRIQGGQIGNEGKTQKHQGGGSSMCVRFKGVLISPMSLKCHLFSYFLLL